MPDHGRGGLPEPALPDDDGSDPGQHEHDDGDEPDPVHVQRPEGRPRRPVAPAHPVRDQLDRLDRRDDAREQHREPRQGDVVEDPTQRVPGRPPVRPCHQDAVRRVPEGHAGGEHQWQRDDRPGRQLPAGGRAGGEPDGTDLRRGVEPEPEQQPHGVHLPGVRDQAVVPTPEDPVEEPSTRQQVRELRLVVHPLPRGAPRPHEPDEHRPVERREQVQERRGHQDPDHPAEVREAGLEADGGLRREGDDQGQREHHGGVAEGEGETDTQRVPALLHEVAGRVVDRRDVVRVERVPHPEQIGREPRPRVDRRRPGRRAQLQTPPVVEEQSEPEHVEHEDDAVQRRQPRDADGAPLRQGPRVAAPHRAVLLALVTTARWPVRGTPGR